MSTTKGPGSNYDFLFEYVLEFLQSAKWTGPINTFVDENCIVFDAEEDHKLSFTQVHNNFKLLVETLLTTHLAEIGVSEQDFAAACASGIRSGNKVHRKLFDMIVAVDDYISFKRVMTRRNRELNEQALQAIAQHVGGTAPTPSPRSTAPTVPLSPSKPSSTARAESADVAKSTTVFVMPPTTKEQEQKELQLALTMSQEETQRLQNEAALLEKQLQEAIEMSLQDAEMHASGKCEELEEEKRQLQQQIALSVAVEREFESQIQRSASDDTSLKQPESDQRAPSTISSQPELKTVSDVPPSVVRAPSTLRSLPPVQLRRPVPAPPVVPLLSPHRSGPAVIALESTNQDFKHEEPTTKPTNGQLPPEELARRQAFLRAQRDQIIMKRNAKANGTVASEEKLNSSTSLSGSRSTSKLSHSQLELNATTKGTSSAVPSAAEQHEMMVRVALAHRLRQNMMETVRRKVQETDQEDSRRVQASISQTEDDDYV